MFVLTMNFMIMGLSLVACCMILPVDRQNMHLLAYSIHLMGQIIKLP